jgi:hypothetical protein
MKWTAKRLAEREGKIEETGTDKEQRWGKSSVAEDQKEGSDGAPSIFIWVSTIKITN